MFTHNMEEKINSRVDIIDLDADTVHDMIIYIYSGKVTGELEGKATGLLSAAEKYDLKVNDSINIPRIYSSQSYCRN